MNGWLTWVEPLVWLKPALEIAILTVVIYSLLVAFERISAGGKIKGISLFVVGIAAAWLLARAAGLFAITWLLQASVGFSALVLVVVFQPELRRLFSRLGGVFPQHDQIGGSSGSTAADLIESITYMASRRIGALIVVERNDRLSDYIASSPLDCELTAKSLTALFWKDSPLHDGAVILRSGRIAAAGVILPLTNNIEYKSLSGTRHRAAIGISEDTDALALVVSEETGQISMADKGSLVRSLARQDLELILGRLFRTGTARNATSRRQR